MKRNWSLLVVVFMFLFACGAGKVDNEALKDKVLDAHDEVMPKMGQLMQLKKQALEKASELEEAGGNAAKVAALKTVAVDLEAAHKGMMSWMHEWSENADPHLKGTATEEETTAFYQDHQKKVDKVKEDINSAIAAAEEILK